MTPQNDVLMCQLQALELDRAGAALSFTQRLARDNAWSVAYAAEVVAEYRRFLFLAVRAGHPITPSDAVDQAWHLHLVYTQSYWHDLCRDILGRPLHHGPTQGGRDEGEKFADWYEQTLASYRRLFAARPPAHIWPRAAERFGDAPHFRRINTRHHWLIARPTWARRRPARALTTNPGARRLRPITALALGGAALLAGCTASGLNVFTWSGSPFLWFYVCLGIILLIAATGVRMMAIYSPTSLDMDTVPSPTATYTIAYLAGDTGAAVRAALVALCEHGLIAITDHKVGKLIRQEAAADPTRVRKLGRFEQQVLAKIHGDISGPALTPLLEADARPLRNELISHGLLVPPADRRRTRQWGALLIGIALSVGTLKLAVNVDPGDELVLYMIGLTWALVILAIRAPRLTWRGTLLLADLRGKYRRYTTRSLQRLRTGMNDTEPDDDLFANIIPLLVGLFGTHAWGVTSETNAYLNLGITGCGGDAGGGCSVAGDAGGGHGGGDGDGGAGCGAGCGGCGGD